MDGLLYKNPIINILGDYNTLNSITNYCGYSMMPTKWKMGLDHHEQAQSAA